MAIAINEFDFDGPYADHSNLKTKPGIYAVMVWKGNYWRLLDVGESQNVVEKLGNHERQGEWFLYSKNKDRAYAAFYEEDESKRKEIEGAIRTKSNPPCGE
ncbi:MAG: hypothetical protein AB8G05_16280 [Oligoflexales bacterium]